MKLLLLGTQSIAVDSSAYYQGYLDLFQAAIQHSEQPLTIEYALLDELVASVGDGAFTITDTKHGCDLQDYDMVFLRGHSREHPDLFYTVSAYLKLRHIPIINDYTGFTTASKMVQAVQFFEADIPVARTIFVTPTVVSKVEELGLGFPCILKATLSSHGDFNYLVHDADELQRLLARHEGRAFVLQRFVPNKGDYRVIVMDDEVMVIRRSAIEGSHLNNTSRGGSAELIDAATLSPAIIEQSRHIARRLGMTFAGVDVLINESTGEHVFLEVNYQPQLMTGAYQAEKQKLLGEFLRKRFSKH